MNFAVQVERTIGEFLYKIGFIIEQALGHVTYGRNLKKNVSRDHEIEDHWILPSWNKQGLGWNLPIFRSNWTIHSGLQARIEIANIQKQVPLDGLFFHTQVPAILCRKWMSRFPTIISLDATPLQYDRLGNYYEHEVGPAWLERWKWEINVACFKKARHLVTWSEWAKQGLIDDYRVPDEKITVIPLGVNIEDWQRPHPLDPPHVNATIRILFVGGQLDRKGGKLLLDAFRHLRYLMDEKVSEPEQSFSSIELHMVTKDNLDSEPDVYIYNEMEPNSENLKELFYKCDIFCLPSYGDFLPMVLSEAGAAGMPSVSTRIAAIPEIIRDGYSGYLVPPGDVESLIFALQKLMNNPALREEMGNNAKKLVYKTFAAEKNSKKLLDLMKREINKAV